MQNCKEKSNLETTTNRRNNELTNFPALVGLNSQSKLSKEQIPYTQEPGDTDVIIVKENEFLPLSKEERSTPVSATTLTSTPPKCIVHLMP